MYEFTADETRIDRDAVHAFLTESYWAGGREFETVCRTMDGSLCFGFLLGGATVAFARVISDQATFAYLCDVYVLPAHRGCGLGSRLVAEVLGDGRLATVERWMLRTWDAHGFYEKMGFTRLDGSASWMERAGDGGTTGW